MSPHIGGKDAAARIVVQQVRPQIIADDRYRGGYMVSAKSLNDTKMV